MIDYGNRAQDVERAVFEFSRPRRVLATDTDVGYGCRGEIVCRAEGGPSLEMMGIESMMNKEQSI